MAANDPYASKEDKKRNPLTRFRELVAASALPTGPAGAYAMMGAAHGAAPVVAPVVAAPRRPLLKMEEGRFDRAAAPLDKAAGLTRIVQTAPGVFTDNPDAQGQVRYYDQTGNRADTAFAGPTSPSMKNEISGPAAWAAAEQRQAFDMSDDANYQKVLQRGRQSLSRTGAMGAEAAAIAAQTADLQRSPEDQAKLDAAIIKATGEQSRAQLGADSRIKAAEIGARGTTSAAAAAAQLRAAEMARQQDIYERERLSDPVTAPLAIREALGSLENLSMEERVAMLSDPNNPAGARLRATVRGGLAAQIGDADFTPAQVTKASGLRRFFHSPLTLGATAPEYDANDGGLTTLFDAEHTGMTREELELLIRSDEQVRSRNRGR